MKLHPEYINGQVVLMTERGDVISNVTGITLQADKLGTHFQAAFTCHPKQAKDQN